MLSIVPFFLAAFAAPPAPQANRVQGLDLRLSALESIEALGREGTFPSGENGCAIETTACNDGNVQIPWRMPMDPAHPFIASLFAREHQGRFEQISDRSYVKHGFFALSDPLCGACQPTNGTVLGLGCGDTYSVGNNGDSYGLGPPDEIDPWLGSWDPLCSHFDRGEPAVAFPDDCNGVRSLTRTQVRNLGPLAHRVRVADADLDASGAEYWFQGMYVVAGEAEARRDDNLASRAFTPTWNGASWDLVAEGGLLHGTILQRWKGASIDSATNGGDDGRVYVASRVTGPKDGFYHYEYAVHNRDNARGLATLRLPICGDARVKGAGFGDVDGDAANDWSIRRAAGELVFVADGPVRGANPLGWNTIFNFWFDSDAAPVAETVVLDQAAPGTGADALRVRTAAPLELHEVHLGPGCAFGTPPTLFATGSPPRATLGNASFGLASAGNQPLQPNRLRFALVPGTTQAGPCTRYLGPNRQSSFFHGLVQSDASGVARHAAPIPAEPSLEGLDVYLQAMGRNPLAGPYLGRFELSDGLRVRIGNAIAGCP